MRIQFKENPVDYDQSSLFAHNVFDLLAKDHDCFMYQDLLQQLDTTELEQSYSPLGQRAYDPRQVISILIYAYSHGVFSSRQIEKRCGEDLGFMYIAGKHCPNFRVLSDFRKDQGDYFRSCFKQTVALALELKLASLGHVSLDGSKFKANSSKHKAMSYGRLKAQEAQLSEEIEALVGQADRCDAEEDQSYRDQTGYELPEDLRYKRSRLEKIREAKQALEAREAQRHPGEVIEDKKQISFADHDANIMGKKGAFDYAYNAQVSVDSAHQVIVGEHISQRANDQQEVAEALEQMRESTGQYPDKLSMDNGYYSGSNLQTLSDEEIEGYVATDRGEKSGSDSLEETNRVLVKADFEYDTQRDCFICPSGQMLVLKRKDKQGRQYYQGDRSRCEGCVYYKRCCTSKTGDARTVSTDDKEGLRRQMNERMSQPESQEIYGKRKVIVEPVFGQIKNSGFRGFSVRGKEKVEGEFSLVCAVHNIKKMVRAAMDGLVRPEYGHWQAIAV